MCWVFVAVWALVVVSGGYSLVVALGLLIAMASLVAELGLQQVQLMGSVVVAHGLSSWGSAAVALGLSWSLTCEDFLDQESNLCLLNWQADSLPLSHHWSPQINFLKQKKKGKKKKDFSIHSSICNGYPDSAAKNFSFWSFYPNFSLKPPSQGLMSTSSRSRYRVQA